MKPRKVNINRSKLSSEEIDQFKDFDSLHQSFVKMNKPFYKSYWFITACSIAALVGILLAMNGTQKSKDDNLKEAENIKTQDSVDSIHESPKSYSSPITGLEIPFKSYEIDDNKKNEFIHTTGSIISIPKNAFQSMDGTKVHGPILIKYREFHDPLDILLSGIPMNYDSAGIKHTFESAGMIELRAYKDGKPLVFAPNKFADIEMVSNNDESRFNLYSLDDKSSNWTYLGKDEINSEPIWNRQNSDERLIQIAKSVDKKTNELGIHEQIIPRVPFQRNSHNYSFDIEVDHNDFPYLSQFDDVKFEVLAGQDFTPKVYSQTWNDATLTEIVKEQVYKITLVGPSKTASYQVRPILSGNDLKQAMKKYMGKLSAWETEKAVIETDLSSLKEKYEERLNTMITDEKLLEEQKALDLKNQKTLAEISSEFLNSNNAAVKRRFKIRFVGICNIDFPIPIEAGIEEEEIKPKGKKKLAYFMNRISQAILAPAIVYVIEKGKNLIYKFNRKELAEFRINKSEENTIWFITRDGNVAVCRHSETEHIEETEEEYHFIVEVSKAPMTSKESLEAFLLGKT